MLVKNIKHGFQEVLKDPGWCVPQVSETLGERVDYVQLQKTLYNMVLKTLLQVVCER